MAGYLLAETGLLSSKACRAATHLPALEKEITRNHDFSLLFCLVFHQKKINKINYEEFRCKSL